MIRYASYLSLVLLVLISSCKKDEPSIFTPPDATSSQAHEHLILIEPTVSQNCGACPLAHHLIDEIEAESDDVIHMSHYLFGPLHHPYTAYLLDRINKTVYTPLAHVNRRHEHGSVEYYPVTSYSGLLDIERSEALPLTMSMAIKQESEIVEFVVDLSTDEEDIQVPLRLMVVIVEREVVGQGPGYDQRNYGNDDPDHPYYQQGEWIEGFVHTNVIRHVITPFDGELIDLTDGEARWQGSIPMDSLNAGTNAYSIIAFASRDEDRVMPILNTTIENLP